MLRDNAAVTSASSLLVERQWNSDAYPRPADDDSTRITARNVYSVHAHRLAHNDRRSRRTFICKFVFPLIGSLCVFSYSISRPSDLTSNLLYITHYYYYYYYYNYYQYNCLYDMHIKKYIIISVRAADGLLAIVGLRCRCTDIVYTRQMYR
jgi:hypothetical protein